MDFHWGNTPEAEAFFGRNKKFVPIFDRLIVLTNKCFSRSFQPTNRTDDVCFHLGQTCRDDFLEILFLAVNGYGIGASKLLRGLYERSVALAYMVKHSEKADRFFKFGAIQEYKVMRAARGLATEEDFDKAMGGRTTVKEITQLREEFKGDFQVEVCKECHRMDTAFSWDKKDVLAQARDVGHPFDKFYLGSYAIPNMHVHASLTSAMHGANPSDTHADERLDEADFALMNAVQLFIMALRSQNTLFSLGLESDLDVCFEDALQVWKPSSEEEQELGAP